MGVLTVSLRSHSLLLVATLLWGGAYVVGRYGLSEGSAVWLTLWRWGPGAIVLLLFFGAGLYAKRGVLRKSFLPLLLLSGLGVVVYPLTMFSALANTTALNASLYLAASPVLIVVFSSLLFRRPITSHVCIGAVAGLVGVLTLISHGDLNAMSSFSLEWSDKWAVVSAVAWCGYCVFLPLKPSELSEIQFLTVIIVLGVLMLIPVAIVNNETPISLPDDWGTFMSMAYFAVAPSLLAFYFWNKGVSRVGAVTAAPYNNLVPLFGGLLGILFLQENVEMYHVIGGLLIASGVVLGTTKRSYKLPFTKKEIS